MTAEVGNKSVPDQWPDKPPSHAPLSVIEKLGPPNPRMWLALLHVLNGTVALAEMRHSTIPNCSIVTWKPPVIVTDVVLFAVAFHGLVEITVVVAPEAMVFVQPLNVGGAAVPETFVVVATSPEAFVFMSMKQLIIAPALVDSVQVPLSLSTVPWGSHEAANADEAPTIATTATVPTDANVLMLRMSALLPPAKVTGS